MHVQRAAGKRNKLLSYTLNFFVQVYVGSHAFEPVGFFCSSSYGKLPEFVSTGVQSYMKRTHAQNRSAPRKKTIRRYILCVSRHSFFALCEFLTEFPHSLCSVLLSNKENRLKLFFQFIPNQILLCIEKNKSIFCTVTKTNYSSFLFSSLTFYPGIKRPEIHHTSA